LEVGDIQKEYLRMMKLQKKLYFKNKIAKLHESVMPSHLIFVNANGNSTLHLSVSFNYICAHELE
jgi:hypothetical protein